jgi:hypothetical protein
MPGLSGSRPAVRKQDLQRAVIFDKPIGKNGIKFQHIAVGLQSALMNRISRVLHQKEIFASRNRAFVMRCYFSMQIIVDWLDWLD